MQTSSSQLASSGNMSTDHSSANLGFVDAILKRASATKLDYPAPTSEQIRTILSAAAQAPDHGRLRPWRFIIVEGAARDRLGNLMAAALKKRDPQATDTHLAKEKEKALRAPTIIVVVADVQSDNPKRIPVVEQVVAVGAAVQNMFLAARALDYGAMWKTGDAAYDDLVKEGLGISASGQIIAFLYIGTTKASLGPRATNLEGIVHTLSAE